jgi:hypothetical protein
MPTKIEWTQGGEASGEGVSGVRKQPPKRRETQRLRPTTLEEFRWLLLPSSVTRLGPFWVREVQMRWDETGRKMDMQLTVPPGVEFPNSLFGREVFLVSDGPTRERE